MKYAHGETLKVLPLLAPVDLAASTNYSSYVDLDLAASWIEFEVSFGAMTSTDTTDGIYVTLEASTAGASSDTNTAIAFNYQLSAAVNTDTMGAVSTATSSGVLVDTTEDNSVLLCYADPAVVQAAATDAQFVAVGLSQSTTDLSASIVGVVARFIPRYAMASQPSST